MSDTQDTALALPLLGLASTSSLPDLQLLAAKRIPTLAFANHP